MNARANLARAVL